MTSGLSGGGRGAAARLVVVLLAGACLLAGGCVAIPESSTATVAQRMDDGSPGGDVQAPDPELDAPELARAFVQASARPDDDHAEARAYLTDEAQRQWDTESRITLVDELQLVIHDQELAVSEAPDDVAVVRVTARRIGRIEPDMSFVPDWGTHDMRLVMTKESENQGWRISQPPTDVVMTVDDFNLNYQQVQLYFHASDRPGLVPDLRYIPAQPSTAHPGKVVELLQQGPSASLAGAVAPVLPRGAAMRSNVSDARDAVIEVNLSNLGKDPTPESYRRMVAGIVLSVQSVTPRPVRVMYENVDVLPEKKLWRMVDFRAEMQAFAPNLDLPGLMVRNGRVETLTGEPVPGPAGAGDYRAETAAQSVDGSQLAVVGRDVRGRPTLWVGGYGEDLLPVEIDAETLTRPTWRAGTSELWTVVDGDTVLQVVATGQNGWVTRPVPHRLPDDQLPITDLRLSPDGMRVAVVGGDDLLVASVSSDNEGPRIGGHHVLHRIGEEIQARSVAWQYPAPGEQGSEYLIVAVSGKYPVMRISPDGMVFQRYQQSNLTQDVTTVTAFPKKDVMVADQNGLWTVQDVNSYWQQHAAVKNGGAVPIYPG
ncbi:LpqB family beta-propeller domain-containing protein [Actinoalloteichus spitiensis]|uniref:LpqB family beta-propeller domain-containing protein n=1 Tax=Actinoalloteichus spitiensis TaxID=252394 RepID=UPI0012F64FFD|nr:LpqB family beta-propeller domain-containing protein [Actinoalloteichus spitiensis]